MNFRKIRIDGTARCGIWPFRKRKKFSTNIPFVDGAKRKTLLGDASVEIGERVILTIEKNSYTLYLPEYGAGRVNVKTSKGFGIARLLEKNNRR